MKKIKKITLKIGGEIGKYHTLPIDYLISISKNLQSLILDIARYDLSNKEGIDLNDFKLEFVSFEKSSAVPSYIFSPHIQTNLIEDVKKQREETLEKFSELMDISHNGDYIKLKERYIDPAPRKYITDSLYTFVNGFGNTPVTISDNKKSTYKISPFKPDIKNKILLDIKSAKEEKVIPKKHIQLAKVEITEGKFKPNVLQLFDKKYSNVEFAPEIIIAGDKTYKLKFPLYSRMDIIDEKVQIENEFLGIYAYGENSDEAEKMFSEEFDYIYKRYNELSNDKLTDDVKQIKSYMNYIVR
ncbi:MAG: hypothetical protein V1781_10190 [Bacteroidota bacterium]